MAARSAGIVLYRRREGGLDVLLGHMGGPFWARRSEGAWSIPKGEYAADEEPLDVARREFLEETGTAAPTGPLLDLGAGTGQYLAHVLERLPGEVGLALDVSKYASRRAAKAHPRASAVLADAWQALPEPSRNIAPDWGAKLRQRASAEESARSIYAEALSTLEASAR